MWLYRLTVSSCEVMLCSWINSMMKDEEPTIRQHQYSNGKQRWINRTNQSCRVFFPWGNLWGNEPLYRGRRRLGTSGLASWPLYLLCNHASYLELVKNNLCGHCFCFVFKRKDISFIMAFISDILVAGYVYLVYEHFFAFQFCVAFSHARITLKLNGRVW